MEYRALPHGGEKISIIGLGMGSIHNSSTSEVERIIRTALDSGINYFDFVPSKAVAFEGYARALKGQRERAMLQVHIGADYSRGEYGWTTDPSRAIPEFEARLKLLGTDYADFGSFAPPDSKGRCVYCNHCQPCPQGILIGLANKYYDLARLGDEMAADHYRKLEKHASDCTHCGHCDSRCPFGVAQSDRMSEIESYFEM